MIAAIAVLYHPDIKALTKLVQSVLPQVDHIYLIDNTPDISIDVSLFNSKCISYQNLGKNFGIAKAQNIGIREAKTAGFDHVLLLDQDSCLSPEIVKTLTETECNLLAAGQNIAAVGPLYRDLKTLEYAAPIRFKYFHLLTKRLSPKTEKPVPADYIIASGSFIRMSVIENIGLMQEDIFIDGVDVEWGQRARAKGYSFFIAPSATMEHCMGDGFIKVFGRNIFLHSDIRHQYLLRNSCHFLTLAYFDFWWKVTIACRIPFYLIVYSMTSRYKVNAFRCLIRSCINGFRGKLGQIAT